MPSPDPGWAGLVLSTSGAELSSTLLDDSQTVIFFYPTLASLWDREKSILPRYVLPRPLSMLHDCLFRPSLLFCEELETLFWG